MRVDLNSIKRVFVPFTPRSLSLILSACGALCALILYNPLRNVFAGEWIVQQQIDVLYIESLFTIPIGQISIRYYAICLAIGMLSGYSLALFLSKRQHIASTVIDRLFIGLIVFGVIGSRLMYVLFNWSIYSQEWISVIEITKGGLSFFGMIIAGLLYVILYTRRFRFNTFEFLDVLAPSVLLGQVIGRWGNFFNYEAYGPATNVLWKMFVPDLANLYTNLDQSFFHPTFLYEIIPNALLLLGLLFFYKPLTHKRSGLVFALYAFGYGIIRFCTEFYRLDALTYPLDATYKLFGIAFDTLYISQIAAFALALIGFITFIYRRKTIYISRTMTEIRIKQ